MAAAVSGLKPKHQAHQPLIGSKMTANVLAEVPFTELFFSESDRQGYKIFSFVARMLKDFYRHYANAQKILLPLL